CRTCGLSRGDAYAAVRSLDVDCWPPAIEASFETAAGGLAGRLNVHAARVDAAVGGPGGDGGFRVGRQPQRDAAVCASELGPRRGDLGKVDFHTAVGRARVDATRDIVSLDAAVGHL